jgi:ketosteroid isomerase-like protein
MPRKPGSSCIVGKFMLRSASLAHPSWPLCGGERFLSGRDAFAAAAAFKRWTPCANGGHHGTGADAMAHEPGEDLMSGLIDRLVVAMNAHDLDAAAGFFHEDYRSEQPAHPGRSFTGRAQMRANWEAMFAGVPDFHAEICRSVQDGDTTWTEWRWSGTCSDGQPFAMRGVTLFEITDDQVVAGRLYMEEAEQEVVGIEQAVELLSGRRPRPTQQ